MNMSYGQSWDSPRTSDRTSDGPSAESRSQTETKRSTTTPLGTDTDRAGGERTAARRALLNELHWLDHLAALIAELRPDWHRDQVRAAAASRDTPKATTITAAIACALDPDTRHPGRIATYDARQPTPTPPQLRCAHGVAATWENTHLIGLDCQRCHPTTAMPKCAHGKFPEICPHCQPLEAGATA